MLLALRSLWKRSPPAPAPARFIPTVSGVAAEKMKPPAPGMSRPLFQKRSQLLICTHNETLSVAVCVKRHHELNHHELNRLRTAAVHMMQ
jgi:hypothetical protein